MNKKTNYNALKKNVILVCCGKTQYRHLIQPLIVRKDFLEEVTAKPGPEKRVCLKHKVEDV